MRSMPAMFLMTVALAACGDTVGLTGDDPGVLPGGAVTATAITAEARPAGVVEVRFENTGALGYSFNPCTRLVEREEGEGWVALPPELRLCAAVVVELDAGATILDGADVPADAAPGRYRFVFPMLEDVAGGRSVSIRSTPFSVR